MRQRNRTYRLGSERFHVVGERGRRGTPHHTYILLPERQPARLVRAVELELHGFTEDTERVTDGEFAA